MRFVTVKSVEQQDIQATHRVRESLVHQRTALINQVRGLLGERGITNQGARAVLIYVAGKSDARSRWLQKLILRRGYNRAAVALANKNARVVQALLSSDAPYRVTNAP